MKTVSVVKVNILILAFISVVTLGFLAWLLPGHGDKILIAAGGLFGGFAAVMKNLVEPDPDPAVPASVVVKMLENMKSDE